jgi:hypothetical protein
MAAKSYTVKGILASLGYSDPLVAARQHARMILLGRLARYQAAVHQLEAKWGCSLEELRTRYTVFGDEDFGPTTITCSGSGTPMRQRPSRPNSLLS